MYRIVLVGLAISSGCSNDISSSGTGTGTGTGNAESTSAGVGGTTTDGDGGGSDTGDTETGGVPPEDPVLNCDDEYDPLPPGVQVDYGFEQFTLDGSVLCPDLTAAAERTPYPMYVYFPADPQTGELIETSPPSPRPWIVMQHGNLQDGGQYEHIIEPLLDEGFVVFSPNNGLVSGGNWDARADLVECTLRWATEVYAESESLGSCIGLMGHSNGGAGAVATAFRLAFNGNFSLAERIGAVVAIAPASITQFVNINAELNPPLFVLSGSHDHDTTINSIENYEAVGNEGALNLSSGRPGSRSGRIGEKVLIEAFDVSHNAFGGKLSHDDPRDFNEISYPDMNAKGAAVAAAYVPAFFRWQFFGDRADRPLFTDNEIPTELEQGEWWSYLSQSSGTPLVFGQYQMGDRRGIGNRILPIATFETSEGASGNRVGRESRV